MVAVVDDVFSIKVYQQEDLVLNGREQIVQADKLEDLGFPKSDEEGQGFGRLMLGDIAAWTSSEREEQLKNGQDRLTVRPDIPSISEISEQNPTLPAQR